MVGNPHEIEPGTVADVWADEVECPMPVGRPFDGLVEHDNLVSPTCLVHLECNRCVPSSFANRLEPLDCTDVVAALEREPQIRAEQPDFASANSSSDFLSAVLIVTSTGPAFAMVNCDSVRCRRLIHGLK